MGDILLVYIIGCILILGSSCEECGSSMDDDKMYDELVTIMEPYCFVNECMIRIRESNVLLNIINNTGDCIIATNLTNLFVIFANNSILHNCSSDTTDQFDTSIYVILNIIFSIAIIAALTNVTMHLIFKELRTVAGILIIILCISLSIILIFDAIHVSMIYYGINSQAEICAMCIYIGLISVNINQTTRIGVLAHFAYTMYRSYRLFGVQHNERSWLCKYITFIIGASAVCSSIIITLDVVVNRKAFDISDDGQCIPFFDTSEQDGIQVSMANVIYFAILLIWLLLKVILATIGIILYFLTTRQCCIAATSRDFRVFIILIVTVDLNTLIFILLLVTNASTFIFMLVLSISAAIEQLALFVFFASTSKVMCCCMQGRKCHSNSNCCMDSPCELTCTVHEKILAIYVQYSDY